MEGVITGNAVKTTTSNSNKSVVLFENGESCEKAEGVWIVKGLQVS